MTVRKYHLLASSFLFLFVVFFVTNVGSQLFLINQRPQSPEVNAGRVYPLHVHGITVFVNYVEHLLSGPLTRVLAAVSGIAYVVSADSQKNRIGWERIHIYRARYYLTHAPHEPEPKEGRIYALKVAGDTVFLTDD